jgi:hypothetical protein
MFGRKVPGCRGAEVPKCRSVEVSGCHGLTWVSAIGGALLVALAASPGLAQPPGCLTSHELGQALLETVRAQQFHETEDYLQNHGLPVAETPSVDVSVIAFPEGCAPAYANVLLSRDDPEGHRVTIDRQTLEAEGVRWMRDRRDPKTGESVLWRKGADWDLARLEPLLPDRHGARFVVPYPASAVKLLPAIGVLRLVDRGVVSLEDPLVHDGRTANVLTWLDEMITVSSNGATFALTRLLHEHGEIVAEEPDEQRARPCEERTERRETRNTVHDLLNASGLRTLRYTRTRPCDGSFLNSAGAGVGQHHMTSWDAARLLWLLDESAPPPAWTIEGRRVDAALLSPASTRLLLDRLLGEQALHEALSTTATCGQPGRAEGIPARLPERWLANPAAGDFGVELGDTRMSADVRPCQKAADVHFAHKTGLTENYGSDIGIVGGLSRDGGAGRRRHYIVAFFSSLGSRYTPACATGGLCYTQRIPALGRAIDDFLKRRLER